MARRTSLQPLWSTALTCFLTLLSTAPLFAHASSRPPILGTDANGVSRYLQDDRYPALYTGDFGDCMGGQSLLNVTSFDAAYYADNMTVLFHLSGTHTLRNASIIRMSPI